MGRCSAASSEHPAPRPRIARRPSQHRRDANRGFDRAIRRPHRDRLEGLCDAQPQPVDHLRLARGVGVGGAAAACCDGGGNERRAVTVPSAAGTDGARVSRCATCSDPTASPRRSPTRKRSRRRRPTTGSASGSPRPTGSATSLTARARSTTTTSRALWPPVKVPRVPASTARCGHRYDDHTGRADAHDHGGAV